MAGEGGDVATTFASFGRQCPNRSREGVDKGFHPPSGSSHPGPGLNIDRGERLLPVGSRWPNGRGSRHRFFAEMEPRCREDREEPVPEGGGGPVRLELTLRGASRPRRNVSDRSTSRDAPGSSARRRWRKESDRRRKRGGSACS